ncbi:MAG TPA: helix-turn-helix domain-containing protein [Solirubrobacteraceae bacterium]|nr:helix-turn-helix domain-containing protein [Solirubrobacteraceae bacterium]
MSSTVDHTLDGEPDGPAGAATGEPGVDAFVRAVASNVRALRAQAGLTLADLATAAGLGKSTLAQLESGKANPSVETLWAIAAALRVPFARIVEEDRPSLRVVRASEVQPLLSSETPGWAGRLLSAAHSRGTFDLYALDLDAGAVRHADPHHAGVTEHLLVVTGRLRAGPAGNTVELGAGDLVTFGADVPHVYEALETTHCVLLMAYP